VLQSVAVLIQSWRHSKKGKLPVESHSAKVVAIEAKAYPFSAFCSTAMCCQAYCRAAGELQR